MAWPMRWKSSSSFNRPVRIFHKSTSAWATSRRSTSCSFDISKENSFKVTLTAMAEACKADMLYVSRIMASIQANQNFNATA